MNFAAALQAESPEARAALIRREIEGASWGDHLTRALTFGGWPEAEQVRSVQVVESADEIVVSFGVSFTETVPSGCHLYMRPHDGWADLRVRIDRRSGDHQTTFVPPAANDD